MAYVTAFLTAAAGFFVMPAVAIFIMAVFMPSSLAAYQQYHPRGKTLTGVALLLIALIGGYVGYRLGM